MFAASKVEGISVSDFQEQFSREQQPEYDWIEEEVFQVARKFVELCMQQGKKIEFTEYSDAYIIMANKLGEVRLGKFRLILYQNTVTHTYFIRAQRDLK